MSCIYKGKVIETELSKNARGGTEMMRDRLLRHIPKELLEGYAIHLSRPREIYRDVKNILWLHDLAEDPENKILLNDGWKKFHYFVFVSQWQRDMYIAYYNIPYSKCVVISNAVDVDIKHKEKPNDIINFVYHTTPHRGLELLYPIFDSLSKKHNNIHLDVFSSFEIYGWGHRDEPYKELFDKLRNHPKITYHGSKDNQTVLNYLEKAHIFLYPCIWKETSCIALIEAIRSGCLAIHPNYGALTETAEGKSVAYEYTENLNDHANVCYQTVDLVLNAEKKINGTINNFVKGYEVSMNKNTIQAFKMKWTNILENLKNV